jgi:EpsI family protein
MAGLLNSKSVGILSLVLLAQASMFYGFSRNEKIPARRPLNEFSLEATDWKMIEDVPIDQDTLDVLKADDILSRIYRNKTSGRSANLFVAYFATQRTGKAPHSPKNCLPGAGFVQEQSGTVDVAIPGKTEPVRLNRYVVSRGENQSAVLYWYQARNRTIASEYTAKFFTVADAIRYNRSDTSLVRVVVGVDGHGTDYAVQIAVAFVQSFFEPLTHYLPS